MPPGGVQVQPVSVQKVPRGVQPRSAQTGGGGAADRVLDVVIGPAEALGARGVGVGAELVPGGRVHQALPADRQAAARLVRAFDEVARREAGAEAQGHGDHEEVAGMHDGLHVEAKIRHVGEISKGYRACRCRSRRPAAGGRRLTPAV